MSGGPQLEAVIFDVDGTLVDSERDGHRVAFNLAFEALGLPYRWDERTYGRLLRTTGGQRRIDRYLAGEGVAAAEREELVPELHARKTELMIDLVDAGAVEVRPGVERLLAELAGAGVRMAVATTGSRGWVERLLRRLLGGVTFDAIVTGDEVAARKPNPEAFLTALDRLGVPASRAVAVEDSAEGLQAAKGAALATAMVLNGYTLDHDVSAAELILDGFGTVEHPAKVMADRRLTGCDGVLDRASLRGLLG